MASDAWLTLLLVFLLQLHGRDNDEAACLIERAADHLGAVEGDNHNLTSDIVTPVSDGKRVAAAMSLV